MCMDKRRFLKLLGPVLTLLIFAYIPGSVKSYDMQKLTKWESAYLSEINQSSLASTDATPPQTQVECAKDRYSLVEIQRDIHKLLSENNLLEPYSGEQTQWRGIFLQGLPIGHVNYFLGASEALSDSIDVSSCQTAPCIFNTIYNEPQNDKKGYIAFLFFLKTGYILSGINNLPSVRGIHLNTTEIPLEAYYFKEREFHWMWLWLQNNPESLFNLQHLKTMYRFPQNYSTGIFGCALASSWGWALFSDPCLKTQLAYYNNREWWQEDSISEFVGAEAIETISHEIGHHYDYSAFDGYTWHGISGKDEWRELSNWILNEYHDDQGRLVREWNHSGGESEYDDFVNNYASTKPSEDFADSLAAFRFFPERLKSRSPRKFEYLKQNVFNNRSYTYEGTNEFLNTKITTLLQSKQSQWLSMCLQPEDPQSLTPAESFANLRLEFTNRNLDHQIFNCFIQNMTVNVEAELANFKREEIEACSFLSTKDKNWWHSLFLQETMLSSFMVLLDDLERTKQINEQLQAFRQVFKSRFDAARIAISCYSNETRDLSVDPSPQPLQNESCFEYKLNFYIDLILEGYDLIDQNTLAEQGEMEILNQNYNYSKSYTEAKNRVKRVMQITPVDLKTKADGLISQCSHTSLNLNENLRDPYTGPEDTVLQPWFLNCLNHKYKDTLTAFLQLSRGGYRTLDLEFQEFIYGIYSKEFLPILDSSVRDLIEAQYPRLNLLKTNILSTLKADSNWYLGASATNETILESCLRKSRELTSRRMTRLIFDPTASLTSLPTEICSELSSLEPYKSFFNQGLVSLYGKIVEQLWHTVVQEWNIAKADCNLKKWCLTLKVVPVVMSAWHIWSQSNQTVIEQYTKKERRRIIRSLILKVKNSLLN